MSILIEGPLLNQSEVCIPLLRMLPDYFGIETSIQRYEHQIGDLPTFLAKEAGDVEGFLSLKQHTPYSVEILVMAVYPKAHRRGIGRALVQAAEAHVRELGVEYIQVKTLGPSNPDPGYAQTRAFYTSQGYRPLEEFTQLWDENNPCLIMVKRL